MFMALSKDSNNFDIDDCLLNMMMTFDLQCQLTVSRFKSSIARKYLLPLPGQFNHNSASTEKIKFILRQNVIYIYKKYFTNMLKYVTGYFLVKHLMNNEIIKFILSVDQDTGISQVSKANK